MITSKSYLFGYIRVSTLEQNIDRQLIKMQQLGIEERHIYIDKLSGKDFNRPQYQLMRNNIREGDLVYIDALDRLGRNYDGVISEWKYITRELNADIVVLENEALFDSRKFKTMGDMGKLIEDQFLSLLPYVAEQERKKTKQRQAEGIAVAKNKGVHLGRPRMNYETLTPEQMEILNQWYPKVKNGDITATTLMSRLNLKRNTYYKIIKQYEQGTR